MSEATCLLPELRVYGFDAVEPVILAALVTEDPLLLIGQSGTGKTYLLDSLSEAMGLEHRSYNASLIAFDDLVGFPYPDEARTAVHYLQSPATVWGAESVLIDEISRCKPEHQNRLFSLVHERRIQGLALTRLRYRWAAMNPCSADQSGSGDYTGSEPLDPALADRFALVVEAADWLELGEGDRRRIACPSGEGRRADDGGVLAKRVALWRSEFQQRLDSAPAFILDYVTAAVTALNNGGIRVSPRRSRLLARSLLAVSIVQGRFDTEDFRRILACSLPHCCWGEQPSPEAVSAAHRLAWDCAADAPRRWLHTLMAEPALARKLAILLDECHDPDDGSQAMAQWLAAETPSRAAALAFALYPAALRGHLPVGAEGISDLGRIAAPLMAVSGEISWQERLNQNSVHPDMSRFARVLAGLQDEGRRNRASQFFHACLLRQIAVPEPDRLEAEIDGCVQLLKERRLT